MGEMDEGLGGWEEGTGGVRSTVWEYEVRSKHAREFSRISGCTGQRHMRRTSHFQKKKEQGRALLLPFVLKGTGLDYSVHRIDIIR